MVNIYFETYGCPLNFADTAKMKELLRNADFSIVKTPESADAVILNSCTVKTPTENKIMRRLKEFDKPVILAGCLPQAEKHLERLSDYSLIGTTQINNIVQVVEETINGNTVVLIAKEDLIRDDIPHLRRNKIIEIIPICQGCLGNCSYCKVKIARGNLFSYEPRAILRLIESEVKKGAKEIWLTAQDTIAYGLDININLPKLLDNVNTIKGNFKVRVGMMNPSLVIKYLNPLINSFKNDKIYKFIHIPVQAGNNRILRKMNRQYSVEEFISIVKAFKNEIPNITIATDVIVGFPSETVKEFHDTLRMIENVKPDIVNISRYWPREGTKAFDFKGYSGNLTKSRSRIMTKTFNQIGFKNNLKWMNWTGEIIIDEKGKLDSWIGRNFAYKPIIVFGDLKIGQKVIVKVIDVTRYDLRAKIV